MSNLPIEFKVTAEQLWAPNVWLAVATQFCNVELPLSNKKKEKYTKKMRQAVASLEHMSPAAKLPSKKQSTLDHFSEGSKHFC